MTKTNDKPMRYWNKLANVPREHLKGFTKGGGFRGTDIKPQWRLQVMTETFGPCGIGWTMTKPEFTMEGDTCHCTVGIMVKENGEWSQVVWGVGGTTTGRSNDELFKMSYTDALGNAMVKLGVASDIYMGYFDGSKYVRQTTDEDAPEAEEGVTERQSAYQARKDGVYQKIDRGLDTIERSGSMEDLIMFWKANYKSMTSMPAGWQASLTEKKDALKAKFEEATRKPLDRAIPDNQPEDDAGDWDGTR